MPVAGGVLWADDVAGMIDNFPVPICHSINPTVAAPPESAISVTTPIAKFPLQNQLIAEQAYSPY